MKQEYSDADDREHMEFLARFFRDPRYIRVKGKPVFIVYRPALLPDIRTTLDTWRDVCQKNGVGDVYLMCMESFGEQRTPADMGFDAALEFQPDFWRLGEAITPPSDSLFRKAEAVEKKDRVFLYEHVVKNMLQKPAVNYKRYPAVFPMWDNSPRRKAEAGIVHQSTPELYGRWLKHVVEKFTPYGEDENFIFINAWNEWAEGNHIEPCRRWGRQYLEATAAVLKSDELREPNDTSELERERCHSHDFTRRRDDTNQVGRNGVSLRRPVSPAMCPAEPGRRREGRSRGAEHPGSAERPWSRAALLQGGIPRRRHYGLRSVPRRR